MNKLQTKDISKKYKEKNIVSNVSIDLSPGEVVGLLGPNGAGKTTCFYMITGLINPDGGKVLLNDKDITSLSMDQRAQLGLLSSSFRFINFFCSISNCIQNMGTSIIY